MTDHRTQPRSWSCPPGVGLLDGGGDDFQLLAVLADDHRQQVLQRRRALGLLVLVVVDEDGALSVGPPRGRLVVHVDDVAGAQAKSRPLTPCRMRTRGISASPPRDAGWTG
ncbi:hypothetical protein O1L44_29885 [Streptomyces noursei]|nr:hypothetical protein [Streptomyces noursei]